MKPYLKLFILVPFILFSCSGRSHVRQKSPEELRFELKLSEQANPTKYLTVKYSMDFKILAGQDVINGTIFNSASIAKFKDVVLTVTNITATDTELKSDDFAVYKFVEPNTKTDFEIRTTSPAGT
jgi:hypothetical protein